jgi:hypothetical protein
MMRRGYGLVARMSGDGPWVLMVRESTNPASRSQPPISSLMLRGSPELKEFVVG